MQQVCCGAGAARVLITGSRGYLGRMISRFLRDQGHTICGLDMGYYNDVVRNIVGGNDVGGNYVEPVLDGGIHQKKDVRDVTVEDLRGYDAVIHLAALSGDRLGELDPKWIEQINLEGSLHLAYVARQAGVSRFLYASSCEVYGAAGPQKVSEYTLPEPATDYAVAKVKTEEGLDRLASYDFSPVYMRCARAYGWGPQMRFDAGLNRMVASALATRQIPLANAERWTALVHIEDIARAFEAALKAPREAVHNEAFNIGAESENYQCGELAELVSREIAGATVVGESASADDSSDCRVHFHKIRRQVPSFEPRWTAQQGIAEIRKMLEQAGLRGIGVEHARVKQLRNLLAAGALDEKLRWKNEVAA